MFCLVLAIPVYAQDRITSDVYRLSHDPAWDFEFRIEGKTLTIHGDMKALFHYLNRQKDVELCFSMYIIDEIEKRNEDGMYTFIESAELYYPNNYASDGNFLVTPLSGETLTLDFGSIPDKPEGEYIFYVAAVSKTTGTGYNTAIELEMTESGLSFVMPENYAANKEIFDSYTKPSGNEYITKPSQQIMDLSKEITVGMNEPYQKARAIYLWIVTNIYYDYDEDHSGVTISADDAYNTWRTADEGFANLTVALLNACDIPARVRFDKYNSASMYGIWVEAYLDGRWVMMSPTLDLWNYYNDDQLNLITIPATKDSLRYFDASLEEFSSIYEFCALDALPNTGLVAVPSNLTALVDGEEVFFYAYNIDGNYYFSLYVLACAFLETEKKFDWEWNENYTGIDLISGAEYQAIIVELTHLSYMGKKTPKSSNIKIYLDKEEVSLSTYKIDYDYYFKLRDIAKVMNFQVDWDSTTKTVIINTDKKYE